MKEKMKNLLVLGGLAAVFAVALILVLIFNNNTNNSEVSKSTQANLVAVNSNLPEWYCEKVKTLWEEGDFTDRFGGIYEASSCKELYFTNPYTWDDTPPEEYNGEYTPWYCSYVKDRWDEGGWTERFGDTYDPAQCKYYYYTDLSYSSQYGYYESYDWVDYPGDNYDDYWWNYVDEDDFTYTDCLQVKDLWDQGDWTANYGSTYAPGICKNLYFQDNWSDGYSGGYWWDYIDGDDFTYGQCYEIKQMWDQGDWTANYGYPYAPAACSDLYDDWNSWENNSNNFPPAGYEDEVYTVYTENPFPDTDISTLEGTAAAYLYNIGVIGGFPDGEFKGDKEVNRAEAAKFLLLARYGLVADVSNDGQFSDVLDGQWYTKFVVTAANLGIISGYSDGTFKPGNSVNTAEFLKMLTLTFDLQLWLDHDYTDVPNDSWYAQYAGVANYYNLFPFSGNSLNPGSLLTREEVAVAIYQFFAYSYID